MQFRLQSTDGPAQCGMFEVGEHTVEIPTLFYPCTRRFKAPAYSDMIVTNERQIFGGPQLCGRTHNFMDVLPDKTCEHTDGVSFFIFPKDLPIDIFQWIQETSKRDINECVLLSAGGEFTRDVDRCACGIFHIISTAMQLYQNPKEFVKYIIKIREHLRYDSLIYLPSVAQPANIALLVYCGIDVLDATQAVLAARNNIMLFPTRNLDVKALRHIPCNCPSCSKITDVSGLGFSEILEHNYHAMYQEMQLVRTAIASQTLRGLVDIRVGASTHLVNLLRHLDKDGESFLEKRAPISQQNVLFATTFDSAHRPEIKRFQHRVIERYEKPKSASVLLLLPCSMKKPYSFSQSHQKFHDAIFSLKNPYCVHEIILTSPIGLVPRELELIYPASRYDIPVTGTWYADEQILLRNLLQAYLKRNRYERIIVHLSEEMTSFLKDVIPTATFVQFTGSPNSVDAVESLTSTLQTEVMDVNHVPGKRRWFENMMSLASYQFTLPLAKSLLDESVVTGKYPYLKIIDPKGIQLGMITEKRGLISLTLDGGNRLLSHEKCIVHLSAGFSLKGSVFVPGIKDADPYIRRGDEVLIVQNDELQAVGVAMMNGEEMMRRTYGEAVKVRHKVG
ncbi:MAG: archaeosine synthase subunit alpha [Thermoplasmatota archaeon]